MVGILTLGGSLTITDPLRIIAYVIRMACSVPAGAVDDLGGYIYSFREMAGRLGHDPDGLAAEMTRSLNGTYRRIFTDTRSVVASVTVTKYEDTRTYDLKLNVMFSKENGDLDTLGTDITIENGQIVVPTGSLDQYFAD
jgi:hypothetical protein